MIKLTTMTVQLIDCRPDGIRICHVEGESLITVVVPRDLLSKAKQLPDIPKRGIYYLLDEGHGVISRVYAGQTTQGLRRLDAHKSAKDFWNTSVMFLDDEVNIDRDVLDALEANAIDYVRTHGSYETDNSDTPQPYVSPYKEQTVQSLHRSILFRMAALGYDLNRIEDVPPRPRANCARWHDGPGYDLNRIEDAPSSEDKPFHTRKKGVVATGRYDERTGTFVVLAGSQVDLSRPVLKSSIAADRRCELFGDVEGICLLEDNQSFNSPSAAAVFVLGGSQNGWIEWINDQSQTLDYVYRRKKD